MVGAISGRDEVNVPALRERTLDQFWDFAHVVPLHGTVRVVDHQRGFGFVETVEGEVYFHRNSVIEAEFDA